MDFICDERQFEVSRFSVGGTVELEYCSNPSTETLTATVVLLAYAVMGYLLW